MPKYEVTNPVSGHSFGIYEADSAGFFTPPPG